MDASQLSVVEAICREQLAKDYTVSTMEVALPKAKEINGLRSVSQGTTPCVNVMEVAPPKAKEINSRSILMPCPFQLR